MPFLPSVNVDDKVPHVLAKFDTGTGRPLIEYHEALLRGESPEGSYKGMLDAFGIV